MLCFRLNSANAHPVTSAHPAKIVQSDIHAPGADYTWASANAVSVTDTLHNATKFVCFSLELKSQIEERNFEMKSKKIVRAIHDRSMDSAWIASMTRKVISVNVVNPDSREMLVEALHMIVNRWQRDRRVCVITTHPEDVIHSVDVWLVLFQKKGSCC